MPGYISLLKFTPKGLADIKNSTERVKQAKAATQKAGIKWVGFWATMGEYDAVAIIDAPNEQVAATYAIAVASMGNVTTQTMRAFSEAEWAEVVAKLPAS